MKVILKAALLLLAGSTIAVPSQLPLDSASAEYEDDGAFTGPRLITLIEARQLWKVLNRNSVDPREKRATGFRREKFGEWLDQTCTLGRVSGKCYMREYILLRDASYAQVETLSGRLRIKNGQWTSFYDGRFTSDQKDLQIDHVVPLKEAWISGASTWTELDLNEFNNNVNNLIAVSGDANQDKGSKSPVEYLPDAYICQYVKIWVKIKYKYVLVVDTEEAKALRDVLRDECENERRPEEPTTG
ncbi:hypothetical protein FRC02_002214 [Tulasnella sp. 418]|nr:hypothetical protein FRC02_002214 [Tulasnella sp. 418]